MKPRFLNGSSNEIQECVLLRLRLSFCLLHLKFVYLIPFFPPLCHIVDHMPVIQNCRIIVHPGDDNFL
jgi:hypothetical protein